MIGDGGHAKVIQSFSMAEVIAIGDNATRKRVASDWPGRKWDLAVHPTAQVYGVISEGCVIMANVVVQPGAIIGKHVILNSGCVVDHDCLIEDFAHIAPGAHLCGNVHVGEGALVGVGVGIEPGVKIPAWSVVKREKYVISLPSHETV